MKRALITGITGQDGRYLSQLLAEQGYQVFGLIRGQANPKAQLVLDENPGVELVDGDLRDLSSLIAVMEQVQPDEVYNLGAMSFVQLSFKQAELTAEITGLGVLRMLEAVRIVGGVENNPIRFYQASSSEMFGKVRETPQTEKTPFHPRSPYGVAKVFGHDMTVNYREAYDLHASSGILFNHESERRGLEFVTRKITNSLARIKLGLQERISLGNLDSARDWGFAGDYVKAMWMMLQQPEPDDYVIATGETHTIREFLETAFRIAGYDSWEPFVTHDTRFDRPAEVDLLMGDATKAQREARLDADGHLRGARPADVRVRPQGRAGPARAGPPLGRAQSFGRGDAGGHEHRVPHRRERRRVAEVERDDLLDRHPVPDARGEHVDALGRALPPDDLRAEQPTGARSVTSFTRIGRGLRVVPRPARARRSSVANASKPGRRAPRAR